MKKLLLIAILTMMVSGCMSTISVDYADAATGDLTQTKIKTPRRIALTTANTTIILGQVLVNDETVQALGQSVTPALVTPPAPVPDTH